MKRRPVEDAVQEPGGDEQPRRAVQGAPAVVAAEDPAYVTNDGGVACHDDEAAQRSRHHRLPARQDRPGRKRYQPDRADRPERPAERRPLRARRHQHVRREQHDAGDRDASMPDRRAVDAVEPDLDPRQRADEHEADRQEQNRFGAEQLAEVAADRHAGGPRRYPQDRVGDDQEGDCSRPDLARDELRPPDRHAAEPKCRFASSSIRSSRV